MVEALIKDIRNITLRGADEDGNTARPRQDDVSNVLARIHVKQSGK